jgi:hypothetical protein
MKCVAKICKDRVKHRLGRFATPEDAARAYNTAAIELFGEFSHLNTVPQDCESST